VSVSVATAAGVPDRRDSRLTLRATGRLGEFNAAGVLSAADVHVATRLGALGGEADDLVLLGAALAVRAVRTAHVCADLATVRTTVTTDFDVPVDLQALPWPEAAPWLDRLSRSRLVAVGEEGPDDRPLRLVGGLLYLDRYWREERQIAADLLARAATPIPDVSDDILGDGLQRLFGEGDSDLQRLAASAAVHHHLTVVAGGPGTGKTTTVARILALVDEQAAAAGQRPPRVALAAPTGKAAARLAEAVHTEAARLPVSEEVRARLLALQASTLHRLLGWRPYSPGRFRHHRDNRLPHDVVVVDETSMVSLSLTARLIEAVRNDARLVLIGDPSQLASVEAGAVLGDIVGPAALAPPSDPADDGGPPLGRGIVVLREVHRFGGRIAELAAAIQQGDAERAIAVLRSDQDDLQWIEADAGALSPTDVEPVRRRVVDAAHVVVAAARRGDGQAALDGLRAARVLCAHRRGPTGVASWTARVEGWLAAAIERYGEGGLWYVGRPLMITENDYGLRLYNGDTGVVVAGADGRAVAVFERSGELVEVSPTRLSAVETVHTMTVHKSQGSQFEAVAVVLPAADAPILTRELLYTAVTRAQEHLIVIGAEDAVRAAVERPISRASGLRERLWGPAPT
jgi:exodeoxyribonuclease V alpha subunit